MGSRKKVGEWICKSLEIPTQEKDRWSPPHVVNDAREVVESPSAFSNVDVNNWRRKRRELDKNRGKRRDSESDEAGMFPEQLLDGIGLVVAATKLKPWDGAAGIPLHLIHEFYAYQLGVMFEEIRYSCRLKPSKDDPRFLDHESTTTYVNPSMPRPGRLSFHLRNRIETKLVEEAAKYQYGDVTINAKSTGSIETIDHPDQLIQVWRRDEGGKDSPDGAKAPNKLVASAVETHREFVIDSSTDQATISVERTGKNSFALSRDVAGGRRFETAGVQILLPTRRLSLSLELPEGVVAKPTDFDLQILAWGPHSWQPEDVEYKFTSENLARGEKSREFWKLKWESNGPPAFGMTYAIGYDIGAVERLLKSKRDRT